MGDHEMISQEKVRRILLNHMNEERANHFLDEIDKLGPVKNTEEDTAKREEVLCRVFKAISSPYSK